MEKYLTAIIFFTIIFSRTICAAATEPKILADSAILVEASTGRIIWEKNPDVEHEPASMTKMLTCILALEEFDPNREIIMSPEAVTDGDRCRHGRYHGLG